MQVHVFRICGQKSTEPHYLKLANREAEKPKLVLLSHCEQQRCLLRWPIFINCVILKIDRTRNCKNLLQLNLEGETQETSPASCGFRLGDRSWTKQHSAQAYLFHQNNTAELN